MKQNATDVERTPLITSRGGYPVDFPISEREWSPQISMCGIVGIHNLAGAPVEARPLERMIESLHHRGPDANGSRVIGPTALGHTRLAIIDLSGGAQPMSNPTGSLSITFNGEIFNYRELRATLIEKGHTFRTLSDTEVILHLYEEKGEDCVDDLNGQFAFAIWDDEKSRLFLARDRIGIRPLYFTRTQNDFIFASEMKAILCHDDVHRELDLEALEEIFTFWCNAAPRTIFRNIHALPPGHTLTVENGEIRRRCYWKLEPGADGEPLSEDQSTDRLRELLIDATRLRLRADVPVGAYLSGGIDSSIIASMISDSSQTTLRTFSVTFDENEFDESNYQQEVVDLLGTQHSQIHCTHREIGTVFPDVIWHAESPLLRTAPAPFFILSGLVQENDFKVVLTGEGADEILGGYDIFKEAKIRRFWAAMPDSNLRPLLLKKLYPYMDNIQSQPGAYLKAFFHIRPEDQGSPFFSHLPRWELTSGLKRFYSKQVKADLEGFDVYQEQARRLPSEYSKWDQLEQAQYLESTLLLPGYILSSQGDRMTMGHSVEGRFPFLDHHVVEFAFKLPPHLKMKVLNEKFILKRAMADRVPPSVIQRKKQPYRAPDAVSLLGSGDTRTRPDYANEILSRKSIDEAGLFDSSAVDKLVRKFEQGRAIGVRDNMALVGIISTQLIMKQFVHNLRS